MDFVLQLVPIPLWKKTATVALFLQMYITHPAQQREPSLHPGVEIQIAIWWLPLTIPCSSWTAVPQQSVKSNWNIHIQSFRVKMQTISATLPDNRVIQGGLVSNIWYDNNVLQIIQSQFECIFATNTHTRDQKHLWRPITLRVTPKFFKQSWFVLDASDILSPFSGFAQILLHKKKDHSDPPLPPHVSPGKTALLPLCLWNVTSIQVW